jgi:tetraacyldisaccharide 4'-kinase
MCKRAAWYKSGVMASVVLPVPVISVGNLSMGGTGKTPMVMHVAGALQKAGYRPVIVSRGYGGRARQAVNLVSNGKELLLAVEMAGDEPRLMAESLPGVPVVTGIKRAVVAEYAISQLGAEVIVLDDGFQHLALQRDLDLVLFKAPDFLGSCRVFPGGELREPVSALDRAHAFVITGVSSSNLQETEDFKKFLAGKFPGKPVFEASYRLKAMVDRQGNQHAVEDIGERIYGFCGLADPGGFLRTISEQGISPAGFSVFTDHHPYTEVDLAALVEAAGKYECEALLTTEKDMVKLRGIPCELPVYAFRVELELTGSFNDLLLKAAAVKIKGRADRK